jgi:hypothetical protein
MDESNFPVHINKMLMSPKKPVILLILPFWIMLTNWPLKKIKNSIPDNITNNKKKTHIFQKLQILNKDN